MVGNKTKKFQVFFSSKNGFETEFPALFSSAWFGMKYELFYLPWNGSDSSTKWFETEFLALLSPAEWFGMKSEQFYLQWNGSEQNSERFLFRKTGGMLTELIKISVCSTE